MKKIMVVLGILWIAGCAPAPVDPVVYGPVDLKHDYFERLIIEGSATLSHIKAVDLVVRGPCKADGVVATDIYVEGNAEVDSTNASSLEVRGSLVLHNSQIDSVVSTGPVSVDGLKTDILEIMVKPTSPLRAIKAGKIVVKTEKPIELRIGDMSYVQVVEFTDAQGSVYVLKDRSYVGKVLNGSLKR
jgi:hypothetical protein